jgi:AraC family transcriptional regulator of adaptative response / DNA-3-methyladenine glycosylase II
MGTDTITHLFPTPAALLHCAISEPHLFAMPTRRREALIALARSVEEGTVTLDIGRDPTTLQRSLEALPGVGPWTSQYIALRVIRDPDVFLSSDLGIMRALTQLGVPSQPRALQELSKTWRPWRSYAMAYLWSTRTPRTRPQDHPSTKGNLS